MTLRQVGGVAAMVCVATYLFGFALLITMLAPLGFDTAEVDAAAVVAFLNVRPGVLIDWNTTIYAVNALALAVLVVALADSLRPLRPGWAEVSRAFGLIWATLVLGAGMIANVGVERAAQLAPTDPDAAAEVWTMLHAVELGLGGGNEIAGGVGITSVRLGGLLASSLPRIVGLLGIHAGAAGLATVFPPLGHAAGAIFGLGAIAWFVGVGLALLLARRGLEDFREPRRRYG